MYWSFADLLVDRHKLLLLLDAEHEFPALARRLLGVGGAGRLPQVRRLLRDAHWRRRAPQAQQTALLHIGELYYVIWTVWCENYII